MKLKSAMIRNRGERTRVGIRRKHGWCQLSPGRIPCRAEHWNSLFQNTLRVLQALHGVVTWLRHCTAELAVPASCAVLHVACLAAPLTELDD